MVDPLVIRDFLDAAARAEIVAELRAGGGAPATVYGGAAAAGAVEPRVRRATRVDVSPQTRGRVMRRLLNLRGAVGKHFGFDVGECEEPQFLRYVAGDFFVAHQDGNTPLIRDASPPRRISVVIFLSTQSAEPADGAHGGGSLVLHGPPAEPARRLCATAGPGSLVAFRAETTHEVTPVTHGERYTIVSWYR